LMKFYESLWRDIQDEGVLALMSLLSLFQVRENYEEVKDRLGVMTRREKYIQLLGRYLRFREGERGSRVTLPKLLSGLNEVWTIAEYHSKIDIQSCMLTPNEM
ncbi:Nuclear hormone receptor ligand-binding domain, partial [Trinorchestia longiramus]